MDFIERHNKRIEEIDAKIAKLQDEKMQSLDQMFKEQEEYFAELEKERKEKDEKDSKDAQDILDKTVVVITQELKPAIKTQSELSRMQETELVVYGKTIGADVDMKYTKAKNLENVRLKQG